ncbi:hypothetical protein GCM10025774_28400 [Microbacterium kyungheense]|uniref:Uncharacterized protein n=1 Tax=Microbacterium kyungheense TaxID=1263636 RepID=A0A543EAQ2_9MICO|nr:hypothetical protein FB391_3747 [Microbacterium kyungheense]
MTTQTAAPRAAGESSIGLAYGGVLAASIVSDATNGGNSAFAGRESSGAARKRSDWRTIGGTEDGHRLAFRTEPTFASGSVTGTVQWRGLVVWSIRHTR